MSYLTRNNRQVVTYWAPGAPTGFGGKSFATPVAIKARWVERSAFFRDANGKERQSRTTVYLNNDVRVGGYLFLGTSTAADPGTLKEAYEVLDFRKVPDLRATKFRRRALL